jgi:hypothetical protein
MNAELKPAFDLNLYASRQESRTRLATDLASLALELSPSHQITPFTYRVTPSGDLISPEFSSRDITHSLRWETPADVLESQAALRMRDFILSTEEPFIVVWISPPDEKLGYTEGRMVVGFSRQTEGTKMVENYGICLEESSDICVCMAQELFHLSGDSRSNLTANEIRATPLFLKPPDGVEPLEYLCNLIPGLDWAWEKIGSGEAKVLREQALEDARAIAAEILPQVIRVDEHQLVVIGAQAERKMMSRGWVLRSGSGCGLLNTELLAFSSIHLHIDPIQGLIHKGTEAGVFAKKCPFCGASINKVIHRGYRCTCGRVYEGLC